jgi:hypothetical protein
MPRALALGLCLALSTGCYTVRYHTRAEPEAEPAYDKWHHNALAGLLEASDTVDVSEICPHGLARVENKVTFGNAAADVVTREALAIAAGGVSYLIPDGRPAEPRRIGAAAIGWYLFHFLPPWTPSTVRVWCAKAPPKPVEPVEAAPQARKKPLRIAVIKLVAKTGVEPATADLFTDALVGELRKRPRLSVLSPSDVGAALGYEKQKQLLGCSDAGCLTEIAGAMGADRLVSGNVGRVGKSLVVYLSMVDAAKAQMITSVSERLKSDSDEAFLDALPGFVKLLLAEPPAGP